MIFVLVAPAVEETLAALKAYRTFKVQTLHKAEVVNHDEIEEDKLTLRWRQVLSHNGFELWILWTLYVNYALNMNSYNK